MADRSRPRRSPARYLAPLAIAATLAGVYVVANHALDGGTSSHARTRHSGRSGARAGVRTVRPGSRSSSSATGPAFYIVRPGDSLSTISARTGVSLARLQSLNPGVASTALQVGQRLRLRR
jgi:LysM repeat protein